MRGHFSAIKIKHPDFMDLSGSAEMGEWIQRCRGRRRPEADHGFRNRRRSDLHARPLQGRPGRDGQPDVDADGAEGIRSTNAGMRLPERPESAGMTTRRLLCRVRFPRISTAAKAAT